MTTTICSFCGKIFNQEHYHKEREHHFCSRDCQNNFRKNNIIKKDTYAIIQINSKRYGHIEVLIDIDDIEKCKKISWFAQYQNSIKNYYIRGMLNNKKILLHRYIMNFPNDMVIDHINHNTLDNRKQNLKICTQFENVKNNKSNTSGYCGVQWDKSRNKWVARIKKNGKNIFIGRYNNLQQAVEARLKKEKELFI